MTKLRRALALLASFCRELSDENGYARYLRASGKAHSGEEWRRYIDRRHNRKFKNAKCC